VWRSHTAGLLDGRMELRPYLDVGRYVDHLERYLRYYARERILVLFSHDLARDPGAQVRKAWAFLGLDDLSVEKADLGPHLVADGPVAARAKSFLLRNGNHEFAASRLFGRFSAALKLAGDRPPPMSEAIRGRLSEYYRPFNRALEKLLGVTSSVWDH
jgi:hypothetical protein